MIKITQSDTTVPLPTGDMGMEDSGDSKKYIATHTVQSLQGSDGDWSRGPACLHSAGNRLAHNGDSHYTVVVLQSITMSVATSTYSY